MSTTTAKKPQDRKPKAASLPKAFTVTVRGEALTVPSDALDDFELLDDLNRVQDGEGQRLPSLLRRLLGEDYKRALDLIRDEGSGRVRLEAGAELVQDILSAIDPNG